MSGESRSISLDASSALERLQWILERNAESGPDRRERIATAALAGILSSESAARAGVTAKAGDTALTAVRAADALIAELDKPKGQVPP